MRRWIYAAIALLVIGVCWFLANRPCKSHLTVVNSSGHAMTDFEAYASDIRLGKAAKLEPGYRKSYAFSVDNPGAYIIRFTDAQGFRVEDAQGSLSQGAAFEDSLTLLRPGGTKRFRLRQSATACKETSRPNLFVRRMIRELIRDLIRSF